MTNAGDAVPEGSLVESYAAAKPISTFEYEELAQHRLPRVWHDYYSSGAHDEVTLRENRAAFERIAMRYRVLVDVSRRSTSTQVLGVRQAAPLLVAPTAFHRLADERGEVATARAAGSLGLTMILSTLSNTPLEEVGEAATGPLWYQLYVFKDRGVTAALVERAEASGFDAIVVTVDAPLLGRRERDARNRFELPEGLAVANLESPEMRTLSSAPATSGLANYFAEMLDQSLTWADIEWLRSVTRLPVLVKGVVRGDDAKRAIEAGVNGIIVSNHGGRQLDTSIASIDALPSVVEAVGGAVDVLMDGGVRRGTDILKALALGASAVCVGRPILWGLAVDGEEGARDVLRILIEEFDLAMALAGCASVEDITSDLIA